MRLLVRLLVAVILHTEQLINHSIERLKEMNAWLTRHSDMRPLSAHLGHILYTSPIKQSIKNSITITIKQLAGHMHNYILINWVYPGVWLICSGS